MTSSKDFHGKTVSVESANRLYKASEYPARATYSDHLIGIERHDQIITVCRLIPVNSHILWLRSLCCLPQYRRTGVALHLLQQLSHLSAMNVPKEIQINNIDRSKKPIIVALPAHGLDELYEKAYWYPTPRQVLRQYIHPTHPLIKKYSQLSTFINRPIISDTQ